jgi:hypothetical protein
VPFADSQPPDEAHYGWITAAVLAVLGGVGTLWSVIRKDRGSAITQLNRVIKGHLDYIESLEARVKSHQGLLGSCEAAIRELKSELTA